MGKARKECRQQHLRDVLEYAGANVIVVLGKPARLSVEEEFVLPKNLRSCDLLIGGDERCLAFLPHPGVAQYNQSWTFADFFDLAAIKDLQKHVKRPLR